MIKRKSKGFTLIELLVVIAIIAILMSIMMPALNRVREMGRRAVCGANMRQVASAFIMYSMDYDGSIVPDRGYYLSPPRMEILARPWDSFLSEQWLTRKDDTLKQFLVCPSDRKPRILDPRAELFIDFRDNNDPLKRSYNPNVTLYNNLWGYSSTNPLAGNNSQRPANVSSIGRPAETILLGEAHIGVGDRPGGAYPRGNPWGTQQGSTNYDVFDKPWVHTAYRGGEPMCTPEQTEMHNDGGNYAFIDGSVRWHGLNYGEDYDTGQPYSGLRFPYHWDWMKR